MTKMGQKKTGHNKPLNKVSKKQAKELALRSKLKKELLEEQLQDKGFVYCVTCNNLHLDFRGLSLSHIVALSRGGKTERGNLEILCGKCHTHYEKKPELREQEHPELFDRLREADNGIKNDDSGVDKATECGGVYTSA